MASSSEEFEQGEILDDDDSELVDIEPGEGSDFSDDFGDSDDDDLSRPSNMGGIGGLGDLGMADDYYDDVLSDEDGDLADGDWPAPPDDLSSDEYSSDEEDVGTKGAITKEEEEELEVVETPTTQPTTTPAATAHTPNPKTQTKKIPATKTTRAVGAGRRDTPASGRESAASRNTGVGDRGERRDSSSSSTSSSSATAYGGPLNEITSTFQKLSLQLFGSGDPAVSAASEAGISEDSPEHPLNDPSRFCPPNGPPGPSEQSAVEHIRSALSDRIATHPDLYTDEFILNCLRSRNGRRDEAMLIASNCMDFRENVIGMMPLDFIHIPLVYRSLVLLSNRDKFGRPVLCVFPDRWSATHRDLELCKAAVVYILDVMTMRLRKPHEQIVVIFDFSNFTLSNNDFGFLSMFWELLQDFYPDLLGACLICNPPTFWKLIWGVMKLYFNDVTRERVHLVNGYGALTNLIDRDGLPRRLGGTWRDYETPVNPFGAGEERKWDEYRMCLLGQSDITEEEEDERDAFLLRTFGVPLDVYEIYRDSQLGVDSKAPM